MKTRILRKELLRPLIHNKRGDNFIYALLLDRTKQCRSVIESLKVKIPVNYKHPNSLKNNIRDEELDIKNLTGLICLVLLDNSTPEDSDERLNYTINDFQKMFVHFQKSHLKEVNKYKEGYKELIEKLTKNAHSFGKISLNEDWDIVDGNAQPLVLKKYKFEILHQFQILDMEKFTYSLTGMKSDVFPITSFVESINHFDIDHQTIAFKIAEHNDFEFELNDFSIKQVVADKGFGIDLLYPFILYFFMHREKNKSLRNDIVEDLYNLLASVRFNSDDIDRYNEQLESYKKIFHVLPNAFGYDDFNLEIDDKWKLDCISKNENQSLFQKTKKWIWDNPWKTGLGSALLLLIVGIAFMRSDLNFDNSSQEENISDSSNSIENQIITPFSSDKSTFKIVVLPFGEQCTYNNISLDVGEVITDRLEVLRIKDSLAIETFYHENFIENRGALKTEDYYRKVLQEMEGDHLIFGKVKLGCEGKAQNEVCYNHLTNFKDKNFSIDGWDINNKFYETSFDSIQNGVFQEDLDFSIYLHALISAVVQNDFIKTIDYATYILDSLQAKSDIALNYRAFASIQTENHLRALEDYKLLLKSESDSFSIANYHYNIAEVHRYLNNSKQAINEYTKALSYKVDSNLRHLVLIGRGESYHFNGDTILALNDFNYVIEKDPGFHNVLYRRAQLHRNSLDTAEWISDYKLYLTYHPQDLEVVLEFGDILMEQQNFNEAINYYNLIISNDSSHEIALSNRGYCKIQLGMIEEGMLDMKAILKNNPNHQSSLFNLAIHQDFQTEKGYCYAIDLLDKLLRIDSLDFRALDFLLPLEKDPNRKFELTKNYLKVITENGIPQLDKYDISPFNYSILMANKGKMELQLGRLEESLESYISAVNYDPHKVIHIEGLLDVYRRKNEIQNLKNSSLLKRLDSSSELFQYLGKMFYYDGDYENALFFYLESLPLKPSGFQPDLGYKLGKIYDKLGKPAIAKKYYDKALQEAIENQVCFSFHYYSQFELDEFNYSKALEFMNMYSECIGNDLDWNDHEMYGIIYDCLGNSSKSVEHYQKYIQMHNEFLKNNPPPVATINK